VCLCARTTQELGYILNWNFHYLADEYFKFLCVCVLDYFLSVEYFFNLTFSAWVSFEMLFNQIMCNSAFSMYTSPVRSLRTVVDNRVVCVRFRDPKYPQDFIFPSVRLDGAIDPPNVLKPGEYNGSNRGGGGGGRGRGGDYRPQMGFAPRHDQASLGQAGHRMLSHHVPPTSFGGAYSSVPPPLMMGQPEGGYPSQRGQGGYGNNRGGANNYGGQDRQQRGGYNNYRGQERQQGYNYQGGSQQRGGGYQNRGGQWSGGQQRGGGYGGGQNNRGPRGNRGGGYGGSGYFTSGYKQ
jgi:Xrn1 helical domain